LIMLCHPGFRYLSVHYLLVFTTVEVPSIISAFQTGSLRSGVE
jgi:hypothetical protein